MTAEERLQELEYFRPTPEEVNNLPEGLRRYIMQLETRCDPAGDVQTIAALRENIDALSEYNKALEQALTALKEPYEQALQMLDRIAYREGYCRDVLNDIVAFMDSREYDEAKQSRGCIHPFGWR